MGNHKPPTQIQLKTLLAIKTYSDDFNIPPSYYELMDIFHVSIKAISDRLNYLINKDLLKHEHGRNRDLVLTDAGKQLLRDSGFETSYVFGIKQVYKKVELK